MRTDITLSNARIYNFLQAEIKVSAIFEVRIEELDSAKASGLRWFSDNDQVLDITVDETHLVASIIAKNLGESTILILDDKRNVVRELRFKIVETFLPPADMLEATANDPIQK